ncbi:hypothetical protein FHW12_002623 [Dokdonella fugitiva]|uniref:Lysylphosphatidylglycerol synthase-like protein n=1 Tax=Dokdonella fugitiva TaxID=328517 RepID=A0A839F5P0_9GAMM|nr:hypothetical protein [Dokdonella fugitiva]MBA8888390.1 hypothetical protein [Dokdonella fugitiva]
MPAPVSPWWRAANVAGTLLCLVAIAFLVQRGYTLGDSLGDGLARIGARALLLACACYAAAAALLGLAWVTLVRVASGAQPEATPLFASHLRSQLAKYLPGNVFHLAYRHVTARRAGVGHAPLALALGMESALLIASAAVFSMGVVTDARVAAVAPWAHGFAWVGPLLPLAAALAASIHARHVGGAAAMPRVLRAVLFVLAIDFSFFVLATAALRSLGAGAAGLPIASWCGWLALAWLLGYVMPGAPAGVGVRETVLVIGLGPALGEADALVLALAYRFVTIVVDALSAGVGFLLRERT